MKSTVCLFGLTVKRRSAPSFLEQRSVGSPTVSENIENLIISVKMIKREMDLKECCSAAEAVADEAAVTASMTLW